MERLGRETFGRMDLQQKGYVTRKEYVQIKSNSLGEELAGVLFDAMDTDRKGKVITKFIAIFCYGIVPRGT